MLPYCSNMVLIDSIEFPSAMKYFSRLQHSSYFIKYEKNASRQFDRRAEKSLATVALQKHMSSSY